MHQVLVDTSVWIDFLSDKEPGLRTLLLENRVTIHPFIIGEITVGQLKNRDMLVLFLNALNRVPVSLHEHVVKLMDYHKLYGKGVGWIDLHLLSAAIENRRFLWTKDKRLNKIAKDLAIAF